MDRFWPFQEPGLWPELVRTPCDMDSSICRRSGGQTTCDKREGHCHTLILHRFMPSNGNLSLAPVPESACSINVRGRQKEARVERVLSEACMRKLRNASAQIAAQMKKDVRIYAQLGLLPITVYYVDSWLVSPTCFESTVLMGIGGRRLCSNLKCVLKGSAWKCEVADFGV